MTPERATAAAVGTPRVVSRWQIVALALNDVVGSGVYLLPAAAALLLGTGSVVAVIVAAAAVLTVVLCFAEAASYFEEPGSAYLYTKTAFGDLIGFEVGWMTWLARVASVASLSAGFAQALAFLVPQASEGVGRTLAIVLPLAALTWLNVMGVRSGVGAAVFLALAKLVPLAIFIGVGAFAFSRSTFSAQTGAPGGDLGEAALLLLFAYAGFENTAAPAGEFKNPRRDVPFALITHLAIVTAVYVGVQIVALGTLPDLGASETPLADAARGFMGAGGGWLLTAGAAISILGTNGNTVLAGPRYLYALARDGFGPAFLARLHPTARTPAAAVITQSLVALPLALGGTFVRLAALSVVVRLATYIGTAAALPALRRRFGDGGGFRLPGGVLIPGIAILLSLGLAASAGWTNLVAAAIAAVVGLLIFSLRRKES